MKQFVALAGSALLAATPAGAVTFNLDFEGGSNPGSTNIAINTFYAGGTDSGGTAGPNYGISFTNANFDSFSAPNGLYGITSSIGYMPVNPLIFSSANPFTQFEFDQFFFGGGNVVTVYDGVNGTGNVLFTGTYGQNCQPCTPVRNTVTFAGSARSATISPNANGTGIDNLTITTVPEPAAWVMMIGGVGTIGGMLRRRRSAGARLRFA